jgi:hypothetical protein
MPQHVAICLFEEGAQRFREFHADSHRQIVTAHPHLRNGFYVCPLCLRAFGRQSLEHGHLSIEHVPPRNQGGPFAKVLLCRACNSTTGHELDSHLANRDRVESIGRPGADPESIRAEVDGYELNATISHSAELGGIVMSVDERRNDPATLEAARHVLSEGYKTVNVTSRIGYSRHRWRAGMLKIGYLVTFAHFGYSFAFRPDNQILRDQIKRPDDQLLNLDTATVWINPDTVDSRHGSVVDRRLLQVQGHNGMGVTLDGKLVLVPLGDPEPFYHDLSGLTEPLRLQFRTPYAAWQPRPRYLVDQALLGA